MMITTCDLKDSVKVGPEKLSHITTAIIPNVEPKPPVKGDGFTKMITTHDEPKAKAGEAVAAPAEEAKAEDAPAPAVPKNKGGRPKKSE